MDINHKYLEFFLWNFPQMNATRHWLWLVCRQQASTWTNVDQIIWCYMLSQWVKIHLKSFTEDCETQAGKLNFFFGTGPNWVVSYIAYTKFHPPRPVFHLPSQIFTLELVSQPETSCRQPTNRPISQIPQCIRPISHNAPFCNRMLQNVALWYIRQSVSPISEPIGPKDLWSYTLHWPFPNLHRSCICLAMILLWKSSARRTYEGDGLIGPLQFWSAKPMGPMEKRQTVRLAHCGICATGPLTWTIFFSLFLPWDSQLQVKVLYILRNVLTKVCWQFDT